jgi:hypothetical protein
MRLVHVARRKLRDRSSFLQNIKSPGNKIRSSGILCYTAYDNCIIPSDWGTNMTRIQLAAVTLSKTLHCRGTGRG